MTQDIIFVGGSGRSGSTLLDRLLGQLPSVTSAGEIRDVWRGGVQENRLCGCGTPFHDCPFWSEVGRQAFGGWSNVDAERARVLVTAVGFRELVPLGRRDSGADAELAELLARLYGGIAAASGTDHLVDSSKSPPYAMLLTRVMPGRVRMVHLVRDARGVAYSWSKHVTRPDTPGRDVEMHRLPPLSVALRWLAHNIAMESLAARAPSSRLQYEALLAEPASQMERILGELGVPIPPDAFAFIHPDGVELQPDHTVMGNPMRMAVGRVPLRLDDAWKTAFGGRDRFMVTAMTVSLLLRYGYRP